MIELTDRAQTAVAAFLNQTPGRFAGLRIGIKDVTCSGVTYALALAKSAEADDITLTCGTVTIFVDFHSVPLLDGCRVDFVAENGGGFTIANPNSRACGTGCPGAGRCAS